MVSEILKKEKYERKNWKVTKNKQKLENILYSQQMNKNYYLKETWDSKFNETNFEKYEWIESDLNAYKIIKPFLHEEKDCSILELGCGTSLLSELIYKAGYTNVTCVDFSKRLIKKKQKNEQIKYIQADFTEKWTFPEEDKKYDIIIDKGSIDCVFCDENYLKRVLICVSECYRCLNKGGVFMSFSLGLPKNRIYWFRNKLAPFQEVMVEKQSNKSRQDLRKRGKNYNKDKQQNSEDYFVYICKKGQNDGQEENGNNGNMSGINFDNQEEQQQEQKEKQHEQYNKQQQSNYDNDKSQHDDDNGEKDHSQKQENQEEQNENEDYQNQNQFDEQNN